MRFVAFAALLFGCSDASAPVYANGPLDPPVKSHPDPMLNASNSGSMGQPCRGWECAVVDCGAAPPTALTGVVRDPANKLPVAGAIVYVPNQKETPFAAGATCPSECPGDKPITATLTDSQGRFHLQFAPSGTNVPLVVQSGKWRRRISVPNVKSCADNPIDLRLPKNRDEGTVPKIAIARGCDHLEAVVASSGVDMSATEDFVVDRLATYDIVIAGSECGPFDRETAPMSAWIQKGGTLLASGNQIAYVTATPKFQLMADPIVAAPEPAPYSIDVSSPQAKSLSDWAKAIGLTSDGKIALFGAGGHMGLLTKYGGTKLVRSTTQTQLASLRGSHFGGCGNVVYADYEVVGETSRTGEIEAAHKAGATLFQTAIFGWTCDFNAPQMPPTPNH